MAFRVGDRESQNVEAKKEVSGIQAHVSVADTMFQMAETAFTSG